MDERLLGLVLLCLPLSLLSFGGGQSIMVGLQNEAVEVQGWVTAQEFTELFAISRTAPGPATLIVALLGWHIAGFWGAVAATVAIFAPSSILTCAVGGWWQKHRRSRLTVALERGLLPIAIGLIFAGAAVVAQFAEIGVVHVLTILGTMLVLHFTKVGPYPVLGGVGLIFFGLTFFGF